MGSNVLGLFQEVKNSAASASFRSVNITCHHLPFKPVEGRHLKASHYLAALTHRISGINNRSLQCNKVIASLTNILVKHYKGLLTFHVQLLSAESLTQSYQTLGDRAGAAYITGI